MSGQNPCEVILGLVPRIPCRICSGKAAGVTAGREPRQTVAPARISL